VYLCVSDCQIQQRLNDEKKKLEELEAEHLETGRSMKEFPADKDEQSVLMLKYRRQQEDLEHQQHVLDDLEFQMFEVTVACIDFGSNCVDVYGLNHMVC